MKHTRLARIIFLPMIAASLSSCNLFDTEEEYDTPVFSDGMVSYEDRLILGNSLTLKVYEKILVSPEIYVGQQRMEAVCSEGNNGSGESPVTEILVDFPEDITDGMSSGIDGNICKIRLKTGIEGEDEVFDDVIAEVRLYNKTSVFLENIALGEPVMADTDGTYCIYLDPDQEMGPDRHDSNYEIPMKIAGDTPERLVFLDAKENRLGNVYMRQVMAVSEDYVYAELEFPVSMDTIYTDYEHSIGVAYQDFGMEYKDVLIRIRDGKLLTMPDNSYADGIEHYGHSCQWVSDNEFYFSEDIRSGGQMPRIRLYETDGDNIMEIDEFYPGDFPEKAGSFYWAANDEGIAISGLDFYSFSEDRLNGGLYYETDDGQGHKYNEKIAYSYYILPPFVAGDGNFYAVLGYRRYITGTYMVTPRLYRMEEEAIFKPVADLGEETENTVPHHAFDVTYHGDTYVFHDGGYCKISASGEVTDVERPTLELSGLTMPGKEYWPYNTGNFYYLPEGAPNYCVISLENPDADAEPLYDVSSTYWYNDVMGDVAVFMEYNGSQDSRCKIVVGNTVMYELTLDRLDSSPGRNNWTVTGHEKQ